MKSGQLGPEVRVVDLKTHQRAIVWADGRLELVLKPGVYALWTAASSSTSEATLAPGAYALWKGVARVKVVPVDLREQVVEVAGQEIMTADKVTLRMNAVVTFEGEMKELMNKVIEAQKAAEAALVTRREETAAMRSQANTAYLMEQNPTLMRLREIEALENVAEKGRLSAEVGEGGLAGRVVKLV